MSGSDLRERILRLLSLAPTPVFAALALLSAGQQDSMQLLVCSGGHAAGITGMVPMYLLMSLFHASPWLRICTARRSPA